MENLKLFLEGTRGKAVSVSREGKNGGREAEMITVMCALISTLTCHDDSSPLKRLLTSCLTIFTGRLCTLSKLFRMSCPVIDTALNAMGE